MDDGELKEFRVLNNKMSDLAFYKRRSLNRKERKRWKFLKEKLEQNLTVG